MNDKDKENPEGSKREAYARAPQQDKQLLLISNHGGWRQRDDSQRGEREKPVHQELSSTKLFKSESEMKSTPLTSLKGSLRSDPPKITSPLISKESADSRGA